MKPILLAVVIALSVGPSTAALSAADAPFAIRVIDDETGRGVPLVELETVHNARYVTDSNGLVALNEPALFGERVFFFVRSHGYEFPQDGFGYRGQAVEVTPGGRATLKIQRRNIAQRLYRVTGADIYRDSVLLGRDVPIEEPLLNAKVLGSDSMVNAVYQGRIHWFWGDTNRPGYPLGNFHVPGAVSELPSEGGLDPEVGVNLAYFVGEDGFARPTAKMPGDGPTWIDGLVTITGDDGRERMFAAFVKIKPPLSVYARGLAEWSGETQRFEKIADFDLDAPALPGGHPVRHDAHVYFARPYPLVRVAARPENLSRLDEYESFTCLVEGSRLDHPQLDRTADGTLRYSWKRNTPPLDPQAQKRLVESGALEDGEGLLALRDHETGKPVMAHAGSVYWNEYRKRWVMIFVESHGDPSFLGEVWYAEADNLVGPWVYAVKIATHDRYDFYNPKQHPMFDKDNGRTIFFEGTYVNTFSGHPVATPRYNYNQIMHELQLDDPRLAIPVPIYRAESGRFGDRSRVEPGRPQDVAFFALDRSVDGAIPVYAAREGRQLTTGTQNCSDEPTPRFYGLPADTPDPPATTRPLYEFVHSETGERAYSTNPEPPAAGYERQAKPFCLIWRNPLRFTWE